MCWKKHFVMASFYSSGFATVGTCFCMTGDLEYYTPDIKHPRVYVLMLAFTDGNNLVFTDSRRLGKIAIVDDVDAFIHERGYGVDALKISEAAFINIFQKRRKAIKTALMDQKIIAGVGNEFSDEILFQARIHPMSIAAKLTKAQLRKIYHAMVTILKEAVGHNADRSKLEHYFFLGNRKEGLKCPGCRGTTEFKTVGGRSRIFARYARSYTINIHVIQTDTGNVPRLSFPESWVEGNAFVIFAAS